MVLPALGKSLRTEAWSRHRIGVGLAGKAQEKVDRLREEPHTDIWGKTSWEREERGGGDGDA